MQTRWGGLITLALIAAILIGAISNCDPPPPTREELEERYRAKLAQHRPDCEKLYDQEIPRVDAAARALGAIEVPLNPTYAELRALAGEPDYHPGLAHGFPSSGLRPQYARFAWRMVVPRSNRAAHKAGVVAGCAELKAASAFDLVQWRRQTFSMNLQDTPTALEAGYSDPSLTDETKAALLAISYPFTGTLAGLSLNVDERAFRQRAIELGWQDAATPQRRYRYQSGDFILSAVMFNGRVERIQIWDTHYEVVTCLPNTDQCWPVKE